VPDRPLFRSFWQAGFECSTHVLKSGKRLDLVTSTRHAEFAEQDFRRLREFGIKTVREGLRWHLIETQPGRYDFSSAQRILEAGQKEGIQIIWDLLHFGWPDFLDIFEPQWVCSFGGFAEAFSRMLRSEMSEPAFLAPVNEISFLSWAGGDKAFLNPFGIDRGAELKRQLVRAAILASQRILSEFPTARLVSPEPVIHISGDPTNPEDMRQAAEYTSSMYEAWDMLSGRAQPELGGDERYLDVIGVNYYDRNQWWNFGATIWRHEAAYRPFREILMEVYQRYRRPLFISETGTEDADRPSWLAYTVGEVRAARQLGAAIHGICLYPILNHPGWNDDRHCFNGLWDYAGPSGEREVYQPLADEIVRHKDLEGEINDQSTDSPKSTGLALPVPPAMELRVSTPAAPDEPVRGGAAGILCGGALN
jgi:Beta-galactosidase